MSALGVLVRLEDSRYRSIRNNKLHRMLTLPVLFVLLLAGLNAPLAAASPEFLFLAAALLLWFLIMGLSAFHLISSNNEPYKAWMLSFPYPRLSLLQAKGISLIKLSLKLALLVTAAAVSSYVISVLSGRYEAVPAGEFIILLAAYLLFALAMLPLAVMGGLLISIMLPMRRLLPLMLAATPYTLVWVLPFLAVIMLDPAGAAPPPSMLPSLSPTDILLYSAVLLLLDGLAYRFLLPVIADKGLGCLPRPENKPPAAARHSSGAQGQAAAAAGAGNRRSAFLTLYRLDRSRLRPLEGLRMIRLLRIAAPPVTAAAAYILTEDLPAFRSNVGVPFMLSVYSGFIWLILLSGKEQKQLSWWLLFPYSRLHLLLSRTAVAWVTVMRANLVLACSVFTGILAGLWTGRLPQHELSPYLAWLSYAFVIYTLVLTIGAGLLQGMYYLKKSKRLLPLYMLLVLAPLSTNTLIDKYLLLGQSGGAEPPDWALLGWIALIGLPLAASSMAAGAKHFHLGLRTNQEQAANK